MSNKRFQEGLQFYKAGNYQEALSCLNQVRSLSSWLRQRDLLRTSKLGKTNLFSLIPEQRYIPSWGEIEKLSKMRRKRST